MLPLNYVDLLLLVPLAYGLIRGLFKGLIHELASLAAIVIGVFLAYHFSDELALYLSDKIDDDGTWIKILSYLLIFIGVAVVLQIVAYLITKMLKLLALGFVNRLLGGLFGFAKVLLIMLLLVYLLDPYVEDKRQENESWRNSLVYTELKRYSDLPGRWLTQFREEQLQEDAYPPAQDSTAV